MITTGGEGGLVLTNNSKFYKISKEYHDHGHENNPKVSRVMTPSPFLDLIIE